MFRLPALALSTVIVFGAAANAQESPARDRYDDAETTERVRAALIDHEVAKARNIDVETQRGLVRLHGFVASEQAKRGAEKVASSVRGVTEVQNDLIVRQSDRLASAVVEDSVIAATVRSHLTADAGLHTATDVDVEVRDGVVQLSGSVESVSEKARAATLASSVEGVQDVRNDIAVKR